MEVTAIELLDCALPDLRFGRYPLSFLTAAALRVCPLLPGSKEMVGGLRVARVNGRDWLLAIGKVLLKPKTVSPKI